MADELRPFSFVILSLVGRGGASAHDIVQMMRRGRPFWAAAESHYYAEPKRLERLGFLASESTAGRTTSKRVYSLTVAGEQALGRWLAEPTRFPRIQSEAIVRLLAGEFTEPATLLRSLQAMESDLDEIDAALDVNAAAAAELPHRAEAIALATDLGRRLVTAHRDWLAEVTSALSGVDRDHDRDG